MSPVDARLKHSRDDPPWSWCGDRAGSDYGSVFAWSAARGAIALTFDRRGRDHALTLFTPAGVGAEVVIFGRRFDVEWGIVGQKDAR